MPLLGIRTSSLRPDVTLGFDIYLLISGKHLLYVKRPDAIAEDRLTKLREKNVRQVFIENSDKDAYEQFLNASIAAALGDGPLPLVDRARIINNQASAAVEEIFANPRPRENYERVRLAAANQVALLLKNPEALEHMLAMAKFDRTVYQHSVNVATIAVGLAASVGAPVETCQVLGIGGLLHDIGKGNPGALPPAPESEDHEQHPRAGAGLLLNKNYVSRDVLDIILMHEERIDGKGYPAGVKKLDQIFQVVALANLYDRLVTIEGRNPLAAYEEILAMKPAPYDERLIAGLKDVLVANRIC